MLVGTLAACGTDQAALPAAAGPPGSFGAPQATTVLTAFDQADSAASVAGEVSGLRAQETDPVLAASLAAVQRAKLRGQPQRAFHHDSPVFAIPAGEPACFLVAANLRVAGDELNHTDVSQFVKDAQGFWRLSHNVQVGQSDVALVRGLAGQPAGPIKLDPARLGKVAAEVFARTTGAGTPDPTVVASSPTLDRQLADGWRIYQQTLGLNGMTVTRKLGETTWSACSVTIGSTALAFLTIAAADTVAPAPGGPATVTLGAESPDLVGVGQRDPVSGKAVVISRVEVFLLAIPAAAGPAAIVGLTDAPVAVTAQ